MTMLNPTRDFKYLIRPDGTIRVCTKGKIKQLPTDLVVLWAKKLPVSKHRYDFDLQQFVAYTPTDRVQRRAARAATEHPGVVRQKKIAKLKQLLGGTDPKTQELFVLLGEIVDVDLK